MAPNPNPRYADLATAGEYLGGIDTKTVRRMIARGDITGYRLPGSRLLRVDLSEIDAAMRPIPAAANGAA